MTDRETISKLWQWGYFRSGPTAAMNVGKADLPRLTLQDAEVKDAIRAYQEYSHDRLDILSIAHHHRPAVVDGDPGPATIALIDTPRCECPDFAMTDDDDPDVAKLWNREDANWPDACRREILVGRNYESLPGLNQTDTDKVYHAICNNWFASMADVVMTPQLEVGNADGTRMYHRVERMSGNTLAYHYLARNRCNDRLDGAWNAGVKWSLKLASTTGTHECGHGLGLNHVRDSSATMYYAITDASLARYGYPNSADVGAMRALGYAPRAGWQERRPSLEDLFRSRDSEPSPPSTIEARVEELERAAAVNRATDLTQQALIEYLLEKVR